LYHVDITQVPWLVFVTVHCESVTMLPNMEAYCELGFGAIYQGF